MSINKLIALVAGSALALGVAACGSDSNSTTGTTSSASGDLASFEAGAAAAEKPVTTFPGPDTGPTPVPKGKNIYVITCSSLGVGCVRAATGVTQAGKQLGWNVKTIDGKGDPGAWNGAFRTAITAKADGIVIAAVPPALVGDGLAQAKAAGIPVVSVFNPPSSTGVYSYVRPDHPLQGQQMADYVVSEGAGKSKVLVIDDKEFGEIVIRNGAFEKRLAECSGCEKVASVDTTLATIATRLPQTIASALAANPSVEWILTPYDAASSFVLQGVQQAGKSGTVKVVGFEGDPQAIAAIKSGKGEAATIANPAEWFGWQATNELVRAFAGEPASKISPPGRLITKATAVDIPAGQGFNGDVDYEKAFESLWTTGNAAG